MDSVLGDLPQAEMKPNYLQLFDSAKWPVDQSSLNNPSPAVSQPCKLTYPKLLKWFFIAK